jgi:hypothetical protein
MIDKAKQYKTRDGRPVRIYATDGWGCFPIHGAAATNGEGERWLSRCWRADGSANISGQSANDLVEVCQQVSQRGNDVQWLVSELTSAARRIEQLENALQKIAQHDVQAIAIDALRPGKRAALAGEKKDECN